MDGRIAPEHYFVVPATPGFELLMYWPLGGENWEEELQRSPVVAWRINEDHTDGRDVTESIIAISTANTTSAEKASNIRVGVRHPNGVVSHYADGRTWENEEMWLEWAKEDWREKREAAS